MAEEFSDSDTSYWPPGWNLERWAHADEDDLATLSKSELVKIHGGLRETLRETLENAHVRRQSQSKFDLEQKQKQKKHRKANKKRTLEGTVKHSVASSSTKKARRLASWAPGWLEAWRKHFQGQQWGFVIFRAACLSGNDEDEQRWARFKEQVQRVVELPFERAVIDKKREGPPIPDDYNEGRAKFTIRWEDGLHTEQGPTTTMPFSDSPISDSFRSKYAALKATLEPGLSRKVFLCASPEAVESFEREAPNTDEKSQIRRPQAPFLLAVVADQFATLDGGDYRFPPLKPVFKVAAEALVEPFFSVLDMTPSLRHATRYVSGTDELDRATRHLGTQAGLDEIWWRPQPLTSGGRTIYCKGTGSRDRW